LNAHFFLNLKVDEIKNARQQLHDALEEHWIFFKKENDRKLEKALHAFAGLACLAVVLKVKTYQKVERLRNYIRNALF